MSIFAIILLAISLSFDTFVVSLCSGITMPDIKIRVLAEVVSVFVILHTGLTALGWAMGISVMSFIEAIDHWVAFILLVYVGGKMIMENIKKSNYPVSRDIRNLKTSFAVAFATSIDAFAVGVSMAFINISYGRMIFVFLSIGVVTVLAVVCGLRGGRKIGVSFGRKAATAGGIVLIFIGLKILIEHLDILS